MLHIAGGVENGTLATGDVMDSTKKKADAAGARDDCLKCSTKDYVAVNFLRSGRKSCSKYSFLGSTPGPHRQKTARIASKQFPRPDEGITSWHNPFCAVSLRGKSTVYA